MEKSTDVTAKHPCPHELQVPVLINTGEETGQYECSLCGEKFQKPTGPEYGHL